MKKLVLFTILVSTLINSSSFANGDHGPDNSLQSVGIEKLRENKWEYRARVYYSDIQQSDLPMSMLLGFGYQIGGVFKCSKAKKMAKNIAKLRCLKKYGSCKEYKTYITESKSSDLVDTNEMGYIFGLRRLPGECYANSIFQGE